MRIPEIKLTMLGAPGSGKTTLMHGMYAMLASGVHGYHLFTQDPDDHIDLMQAWRNLYDVGELPDATSTEPKQYEMAFNHGLEPLLHLDFVDFRGGAGIESGRRADAPMDITMLKSRLEESSSIYLVLDGHHVGDWIRRGCPAVTQTAGPMEMGIFTRNIVALLQRCRGEGRPRPSLVVIITKCDVLEEVSGRPHRDAMRVLKEREHMEKLVPFAFYDGVTAMICPVQLGRFGANAGQTVDHTKVSPIYVHKPLVFSLTHYLTEQIAIDKGRLSELRDGHAAAQRELDELRRGFGAGFFRGGRISTKSDEIDFTEERMDSLQKELGTARERAEQLMGELDGLPIFRDGEEVK